MEGSSSEKSLKPYQRENFDPSLISEICAYDEKNMLFIKLQNDLGFTLTGEIAEDLIQLLRRAKRE